jgi:hypothetical protein
MSALDPPHWTPNSCLGHFGLFHYCMNFDAKWAELVQLMDKFVPQSRIGIFSQ